MNNFNWLNQKLFLSTLLTVLSITSVVHAQNNQESNTKTQKSSSILEAILSLFKSPENRLITRGNEVCPISPGNVGEQVIWSDRPLFIWQGKTPQSEINLYSAAINYNYEQDEQLVWTETVPPNSQTITYAGKRLQPGFTYDWELISAGQTYRPTFILMEQPEREAIAAELTTIENKLQANGGNDEERAIAKADYFVNRQLWSDALQQLHSVENPSPELTAKIADITQYLCESNN